MDQSPFHLDEITAQTRAGVEASGTAVRPFMPDQHRAFFTLLRHVFVSVPDRDGWPLATILTGPAGFAHAPSPSILRIDGLPRPDAIAGTDDRLEQRLRTFGRYHLAACVTGTCIQAGIPLAALLLPVCHVAVVRPVVPRLRESAA
jgi:predicted pyridoxine 5'-phosphate oxidase superfamily flavin-nucleotide-binding protein